MYIKTKFDLNKLTIFKTIQAYYINNILIHASKLNPSDFKDEHSFYYERNNPAHYISCYIEDEKFTEAFRKYRYEGYGYTPPIVHKTQPKDIYDLNHNSCVFGILNHTSKEGTVYWITIVIDGEVFQKEYSTMDVINNTPISQEIGSIKAHYFQRQKEIEEEREREYQELKQKLKGK